MKATEQYLTVPQNVFQYFANDYHLGISYRSETKSNAVIPVPRLCSPIQQYSVSPSSLSSAAFALQDPPWTADVALMTGEGEVEAEVVVGVGVEVLPWGEEVGEHLNSSFLHLGFLGTETICS